jgi:hypothetical protein
VPPHSERAQWWPFQGGDWALGLDWGRLEGLGIAATMFRTLLQTGSLTWVRTYLGPTTSPPRNSSGGTDRLNQPGAAEVAPDKQLASGVAGLTVFHMAPTLVASALAEHRDHSQPSVGNLQGMCVIWWC